MCCYCVRVAVCVGSKKWCVGNGLNSTLGNPRSLSKVLFVCRFREASTVYAALASRRSGPGESGVGLDERVSELEAAVLQVCVLCVHVYECVLWVHVCECVWF